jgi:hypothetical protein
MPKKGRPFVYQSDEERPVTISLKLPRGLYARLKRYAVLHRQTISELVRDGLEWRLELEDPRAMPPGPPENDANTAKEGVPAGVLQDLLAMLERQEAQIAALTKAIATIERYSLAEGQRSPTADAAPASAQTPLAPPPPADNTVIPEKAPRPRGRPAILRQPILDCLREHPEGLTAVELKVYLKTDKNIGDTLAGMVRAELLAKLRTGQAVRYTIRDARG